MTIEQFAAKWFTFYYFVLGLLFAVGGIALMAKLDSWSNYLRAEMKTDKPPSFMRSILKYFFIFTIPGLFLSFFPFSLYELLFALWSLLIVFTVGLQLVRWPQTRILLESYSQNLRPFTKLAGAAMILIGLIVILLGYQELHRLFQV